MALKDDCNHIISAALEAAQPDTAVKKALSEINFGCGRLILIAVGKASWQMATAAYDSLGKRISKGIVITKYGYSNGPIGNLKIFEAGHPIPDSSSYTATQEVIELVSSLSANDSVLFLLSGGGSALFEKPLIPEEDLKALTNKLLSSGADIVEINTIRKRMSAVKGGRFAEICAPAKVFTVILSDIIGNPVDMIASGPAYPDSSNCSDALNIIDKYSIPLTPLMQELINRETPKSLNNVETFITGSVTQLCLAAEKECISLGYKPIILTDSLSCIAREAGVFLSNIAKYYQNSKSCLAFIMGGETIVQVKGAGLGGRNQELVLSALPGISGFDNTAIFSIGSDGTDGPTDAAGGYCDNESFEILKSKDINVHTFLENNDSYHALQKCDGLIFTGPTGTNVNDLTVLLIKR